MRNYLRPTVTKHKGDTDMRFYITACILLTMLLSAPITMGQETKQKKPAQKEKKVRAEFRAVEDVEGLPRVLLLGDSISIGYTLPVRKMLKDVANVHRPAANCGPTTEGLQNIDKWLTDKPWDVIHFNWGLHDLKYMGPQGQNLADPKNKKNKPQVSLQDYKKNLRKIVERLKETNAKLIWRTTTPVPDGCRGRVRGDSVKYNKAAKKIMDEFEIPIDDQYTFSIGMLDKIQNPKDVHFNKVGKTKLAEQTVIAIRQALEIEEQPGK